MKVKELIAELKSFDPDMEVMFSFPAHDYWRNTLAGEAENVDEERVVWSEYHSEYKLVEDDGREDDADLEKAKDVVVISAR